MKLNAPVNTRTRLWRGMLSVALTAMLATTVILAAVYVWRGVLPN